MRNSRDKIVPPGFKNHKGKLINEKASTIVKLAMNAKKKATMHVFIGVGWKAGFPLA